MSSPPKIQEINADQEWLKKGVDIWMIRDNLKLSCEERVARHQNTLDFINDLKKAGQDHRARSSNSSKITGS